MTTSASPCPTRVRADIDQTLVFQVVRLSGMVRFDLGSSVLLGLDPPDPQRRVGEVLANRRFEPPASHPRRLAASVILVGTVRPSRRRPSPSARPARCHPPPAPHSSSLQLPRGGRRHFAHHVTSPAAAPFRTLHLYPLQHSPNAPRTDIVDFISADTAAFPLGRGSIRLRIMTSPPFPEEGS